MQALFQLDVQGKAAMDVLDTFFRENSEDDLIYKQARVWAFGAWENLDKCDELIKTAAVRWQIARISPVERSILRLSVYQLMICDDIPSKVVINEGIELAKKYSTESSSGFVNGVLDAVLKNIKKAQQQD